MENEQDRDSALHDDLKLASNLSDWVFAGKHLLRSVERLSRCLPPSGPGPAAELSQVIAAVDRERERHNAIWEGVIRPGLKKHEHHPVPPLTFL